MIATFATPINNVFQASASATRRSGSMQAETRRFDSEAKKGFGR
jgi:hypothetical protein